MHMKPQIAFAGMDTILNHSSESKSQSNLESFINGIFLMGVPKSKVSPGKKRMKHLRYIPNRVVWGTCTRCGEPKRPHRICSTNLEICAMREEDWEKLDKSSLVIKKEFIR
eukprot:gene5364-10723_t